MADHLFVYHGGSEPQTPEEGALVMKAWTDWFTSLGAAVKEAGNPTSATRTVAPDGSVTETPDGPTGYSIIAADSLDAAVEAARGCPVLASGGSVQVARIDPIM